MLARSVGELHSMQQDHRQLAWFFVDKARSVKFQTVKRLRSAVWNYYERMPGLRTCDIPTTTSSFTHRFDGLAQRLGVEAQQDRVFRGVLLRDMVALLRADWARARSGKRVQLALVNAAFHLYFQAGLRANEAFSCTTGGVAESVVQGEEARNVQVRAHLHVQCSVQTKEERYESTAVPVAFRTHGSCPLSTGKWVVRALQGLEQAGKGATSKPARLFFSHSSGKGWTMSWFWGEQVVPRMRQLQREGLGGLREDEDLSQYGSNSPRRTWNSMAAKHPHPVCEDLRERQGRWRKKQRRRQRLALGMASLYNDPDLDELLRATYFLTPIR